MSRFFSRACAAMGTGALLVASVGLASPVIADDIYNNIDGSIDATAESITLSAGGANGSVTLAVDPTNEAGGKNGCNLTGSTTLVVNVVSSSPSKATVSPSTLTFDSCGATRVLTVTPLAVGSTTISLNQASNDTGGLFALAPATFNVNVTSSTPPNTAPVLNVPASPVTAEAASSAGATVNYTVSATDAQDDPDPTPLCTPASGSLFPIGSTTVNCAVTDAGGLSDSDSFTVVVSDSVDPTVDVSTTAVVGAKGWYNIDSSGTAGIVATVTASDAVGVSDVTCTVNGNPSALDLGAPVTLTDGVHNVSCTATDAAGNSGSDSEEFKVDQTNPTMSGTLSPAANTNGWNNTNVTVSYTCADATSGIDSNYGPQSGCWPNDTVVSDGLTTFHRAIADNAGNVRQFDFDVRKDSVNPTISGQALPAANANGWNKTNVSVAFTCLDGLSTIDTCVGNTTLSSETAGQSVTGTATDKAGNTSTATVGPIKIDKTDPSIGFIRTPANGAGWNNGAVTVTFNCTDGLSGVDDLTDPITLSGEGAGQSATGYCTDAAGNTATVTVNDINIDLSKPTISGSRSPAANVNGWNNGDVTVNFTCTENGPSGIATDTVGGDIVTTEGENQSVTSTGDCIDVAGNAAVSATVSGINIDKTNPVITGSASPAPNAAHWNNTNVTVSFSCDETGATQSGIDQDTVAGATLSNDGADQSVTNTGTCSDEAGNVASAVTVSNIDIDKTNPVVNVTGVSNGATYTLGSIPVAGCSTTDALSGVKTSATVSSTGGPIGSVTTTCSGALDNADNSGSASVTYNVVYAWSGFFQPIDNTPVGGETVFNKAKAGQSIPAKFSLGGNQGLNIIAAGYPKVTKVACTSDATEDLIETYAVTANNGLVYDATANQYNYVWKTQTAWANTCQKFDLMLVDGTHHVAYFKFTK